MKRSTGIIAFTVLPALLWLSVIKTRNVWIHPFCGAQPENCISDQLNAFDRPAIHFDSGSHDTISFVSQYAAGALSLLVPIAYIFAESKRRRLQSRTRNRVSSFHLLRFIQVTIWNGFFLELVRNLVQRPRPFVYLNPADYGKHVSHYTSFYSGHTSFTAAASMIGLFSLLTLKAPRKWIFYYTIPSLCLVIITGYTRVMAGRHFPTDVLAAMVAGSLVSLGVNAFMKRQTEARLVL